MTQFFDIATLISAVAVLVALVNIITQVLKGSFDNLPTSLLAIIISMIVTLVGFFMYCAIKDISVTWYYITGAIAVGFMVAYAAMFGFDKLKEILKGLESNE